MKKLILILIASTLFLSVRSQISDEDKLLGLEKNSQSQEGISTATMTSSSRLFKNPDDLTSVIMVIPKGSQVEVLASDSTHYIVSYDGLEGFIYKKHAIIDKKIIQEAGSQESGKVEQIPVEQNERQPVSRFTYLENKYGTAIAAKIYEGKIWKGMSAEMVKDAWGIAERINREINGNTVREEWVYRTTWLFFENSSLRGWGQVKN